MDNLRKTILISMLCLSYILIGLNAQDATPVGSSYSADATGEIHVWAYMCPMEFSITNTAWYPCTDTTVCDTIVDSVTTIVCSTFCKSDHHYFTESAGVIPIISNSGCQTMDLFITLKLKDDITHWTAAATNDFEQFVLSALVSGYTSSPPTITDADFDFPVRANHVIFEFPTYKEVTDEQFYNAGSTPPLLPIPTISPDGIHLNAGDQILLFLRLITPTVVVGSGTGTVFPGGSPYVHGVIVVEIWGRQIF